MEPKKEIFIGRQEELRRLKDLTRKATSSLVVIHGRRRIGKSRLIEEFAKGYRFLRFSGLPVTPETTAQSQRDAFAGQLCKELSFPRMQMQDWGDLFSLLAKETRSGRVVILLDEISWMGSKDDDFLGKLKNVWDIELKHNPELMLILCGSVSSWIQKNILDSTGFMGRVSLTLFIKELSLNECHQFLTAIGFRGSTYDQFKILSVTGGVPRYLEEVKSHLPAEANIQQLCFQPGGVLFQEFDDIFSDLFSKKGPTYKKIVSLLVRGSKDLEEIAKACGLSSTSYLAESLHDLEQLGFVRRDFGWSIKSKEQSRLSHFRLCDNYLRFYLKYIAPNVQKIKLNQTPPFSWGTLPLLEIMLGLQFENLILSSRHLVWKYLPFTPHDIVCDNPFMQRKTGRSKGCQIDYLIQTRYNNLFVCEIKFSKNRIDVDIIDEVKEKIARIAHPKGFSCFPVLIHVNGVQDAVVESEYFSQIIDFSTLLVNS